MIVSFWNASDIRAGATTNAACISFLYALRFKKRVALFENHVPDKMGLYDLLVGKKHELSLREEPMYYNKGNNINYIYGLMKSGFPVVGFNDAAIHLAEGRLHYLPQFEYGNHDVFDYEMNKIIDRLLDELSKRYDVIFVDLKQFHTLTTRKIIERSNQVFVNLIQEPKILEKFFLNYSYNPEKTYFVINKYKRNSDEDMSIEDILSNYPVDPDKLSYLPYNYYFSEICKNGNLTRFLKKNKWATTKDKYFEIMFQLRRMTTFIKESEKEGTERNIL